MVQARPWRTTEVLAAALDRAHTLSDVAAAIVSYAQARLPVDAAVVTVSGAEPGATRRLAATGQLISGLDALHEEQGPGPTTAGLGCGMTLTIDDTGNGTGDGTDWAEWSAAARRHGVRWVHLVGLLPLGTDWARLDLFSHRPHVLSHEEIAGADELARGVGLALRLAHRVVHLEESLQTRGVIGQGQGLVMERYGLDADQAMSFLRRRSQESQVRVRDLARELVDEVDRTPSPTTGPSGGPA